MANSLANGQDAFALHIRAIHPLGEPVFLDMGAQHPFEGNVSNLLEKEGWRGHAVELNPEWTAHPAWLDRPRTVVHNADALRWISPQSYYAFASIDVDHNSTAALCNLLRQGVHFTCLAIEHDAYAQGDAFREVQRFILQPNYDLVHGNVSFDCIKNGRCMYEDWWVLKGILPSHYVTNGLLWQDIVSILNANPR